MQRLAHDVLGDAAGLVVHLNCGHAFFGAGHFEVHVAEMILVAKDVGEDADLVAFLDQAHRDSRDCGLGRHAGVHQGEAAAAYGRHRGAAVTLEHFRDDSNRVREIGLIGEDRCERAFGESAVSDFAP